MRHVYFLSDADFFIKRIEQNNYLTTKIDGYSFILFFSPECEFSRHVHPIFKQLPRKMNNCCTFATMDVSDPNSQATIRSSVSQETNTPICYVPYLIFYINGFPYLRYQPPEMGTINENHLLTFVFDAIKTSDRKPTFAEYSSDKNIPKYSIGIPLHGGADGYEKYFTYITAYEHNK
jgi:thiol-disulfide isomerase/thioredoxin